MTGRTMDTIGELLSVVAALPPTDRTAAVARLERIVELREPARHLALGLLALDLAPHAAALQGATAAIDLRPAAVA